MRAKEFINTETTNEDWRRTAAAIATGAALATGASKMQVKPPQEPPAHTVTVPSIKLNLSGLEPVAQVLVKKAQAAGIEGEELAHLLAQAAHETANFKSLKEKGTIKYFLKKYELKFNPRIAKILGNKFINDGLKYIGRGFVMLTGRYNYQKAGEALGLPLLDHPEMAADPNIAADIAIWYWKTRVRPKLDDKLDATDVPQVTKTINPGMHGLERRQKEYEKLTTPQNEALGERWKGVAKAFYSLGSNGRPVSPEDAGIIKTHVKKIKNPTTLYDRYVTKYNDDWYWRTLKDPRVETFEDLLAIIKKYYTVGQIRYPKK